VIYRCARALGAKLTARGFPVPVKYGPERATPNGPVTSAATRVVVERDRGTSETFEPPKGQQVNPRKLATRTLGAKATIYARSNKPGAMVQEHEALCDQIVNALFVALYEWAAAEKLTAVKIVDAKYVAASELNDLETWPGVIYVLRWGVPTGVFTLDYAGDARPEGEASGVSNTTQVFLTGAAGGDPEIGCGA
jgi:hypothetical protein